MKTCVFRRFDWETLSNNYNDLNFIQTNYGYQSIDNNLLLFKIRLRYDAELNAMNENVPSLAKYRFLLNIPSPKSR